MVRREKYRATNDFTFITIVEGDKIKSVEYPSYGGALGDKLKALKSQILKNQVMIGMCIEQIGQMQLVN
ncbi:MAG: hypothetical protein IPG89_07310 [Bacteroidetes bacterium]|nr:hypothetical protein [Bacteroidota bacterium]